MGQTGSPVVPLAHTRKGVSMNKQLRPILRRAAAFTLALLMALPTAYAAAGEQKLQTVTQLTDGLTYSNTITENQSSRVESYALELAADRSVSPILLQASGTVYGAASVNKAVSYAQSLGYHVLAAVNTDFFSTASGVPLGIVIEDGIYKSSPGTESAITIRDGVVSLCERPAVTLTLTNQSNGFSVTPHHFNKWRSATGGVYLLNEDFSTVSTRTSTAGWYVRMKVLQVAAPEPGVMYTPKLTVSSNLFLQVEEVLHSDQPMVIGADEFILTSDDVSGYVDVFNSFHVGDRIVLTATCDDEGLASAQWAGGVGDIMIRDGAITDTSDWSFIKDGRAPRTALGVKEDGTLLLYAVDGRSSSHSMGLSQLDLAEELLAQGCQWAVNLDGGGSTSISVWMPGQSGPKLQNRPSDGSPRGCATYLLLVAEETGDGVPHRLALKENGLTVFAGTSLTLPAAAVLDSGLNVLGLPVDDLRITASLGTVENGVYTAGTQAGTDTLTLSSPTLGIEGTATIHVVDTLTALTVSAEGSTAALPSITVEPGQSMQLTASGSYWNRAAMRESTPVVWSVTGGVGTVDQTGRFTASEEGGSGTVLATVGGVTQSVSVSTKNVHRDVPPTHWAYPAVAYCYDKGIVGGISATQFGRDYSIRRADFMLMLYNAVGKPAPTTGCTFTDVSPTDYYYTALSWAQEVGLASGTGEGSYSPNSPITREQSFTILRKAMPLLGKECPDAGRLVLDSFADKDLIADYAKGHTATLVAQGIVSGKGDGIDPRGQLTRAEMAALLYKIITYTPVLDVPQDPAEPEVPVEPEVPTQPETPEVPDSPVLPEEPEVPTDPETPTDLDQPQEPVTYEMTLDQTQLTLRSGDSVSLQALISPEFPDAGITWISSDPSAATVSPTGLVTNLYPGPNLPTVTVTASWNGLTACCSVSCLPAQRTGTVHDAELGLNVRSGPSTDHSIIGKLKNETQLVILNQIDGWYQILYRNQNDQAAIGYVSGDYINAN